MLSPLFSHLKYYVLEIDKMLTIEEAVIFGFECLVMCVIGYNAWTHPSYRKMDLEMVREDLENTFTHIINNGNAKSK